MSTKAKATKKSAKAPKSKAVLPSYVELFEAIKSDAPSEKLMRGLTPLLDKVMAHGPKKLTRDEAAFLGISGAAFLTTLHERSVLAAERTSIALERAAIALSRLANVEEKRSITDGIERSYAEHVKARQAELDAAAKASADEVKS